MKIYKLTKKKYIFQKSGFLRPKHDQVAKQRNQKQKLWLKALNTKKVSTFLKPLHQL